MSSLMEILGNAPVRHGLGSIVIRVEAAESEAAIAHRTALEGRYLRQRHMFARLLSHMRN